MFLNFANFYCQFIKNFLKMSESLNLLLKDDTVEQFKESFQIITIIINTFYKLYKAFTTALILIHYNLNLIICIETDAFKITLTEILL